MDGYGVQLVLVLVLIMINAAFSGSEIALVSLREHQLERLEKTSRGGRVLARLARDPNRFLATIQIGITLAGFLASATAAVALARPLVGLLGFLGDAADAVAVVLVTLALALLTLILGELAPKRVAMQRAERWALLVARPLDLLATLTRPLVWFLGHATNLVVRLAGADPHQHREEVTAEELRELVESQQMFTPQQREIIAGAFDIADRVLRQILVPRGQVLLVPADAPVGRACETLVKAGHSRAPVVSAGDLDSAVGVVHLHDLYGASGTAGALARPALQLPDSLRVVEALRRMRAERQQFAFVVDERGSVDGIVTLEDLIEEVVGEIYDETDPDVAAVRREAGGVLLVPGHFPVHDLPDIGVELDEPPDRPYTTVAGLVLARLGHVPTRTGEQVEVDGWQATVAEISGRAITAVRLRRVTAEVGGAAGRAAA